MNYDAEKENLKEQIMTVPNLITAIRFFGTLVVLPFILATGASLPLTIVVALIAATDKLDGWYARKYNAATLFGKAFDGLTDKIFSYGLIAALILKGAFPVLDSIVLIPFTLTALRDSLVFMHTFSTRVKNSDTNKRSIFDDYKGKINEKEKENDKSINTLDKLNIMKEVIVHKLSSILEETKKKEKDPFVVTMAAKVKMVAQTLAIIGFMVGALGVPYMDKIATGFSWLMAECSFIDLFLVKKNEEHKLVSENIVKYTSMLEPIEEETDDKKLENMLEYSDPINQFSNDNSKPKCLVKAKSLPGKYKMYKN